MTLRKLTRDDVFIEVIVSEELIHWTANVNGYDPEVQKGFEEMVAKHGLWGWCHVEVRARWRNHTGNAHLGCCSYESEEDFRKDAYFTQMVDDALSELNDGLVCFLDEALELRKELGGETLDDHVSPQEPLDAVLAFIAKELRGLVSVKKTDEVIRASMKRAYKRVEREVRVIKAGYETRRLQRILEQEKKP